MTAPGTIAVEATEERYRVLKHQPGGIPLDKEGRAIWPADQFTFRLIGEGALREADPAKSAAAVGAPVADDASDAAAKPRKS